MQIKLKSILYIFIDVINFDYILIHLISKYQILIFTQRI